MSLGNAQPCGRISRLAEFDNLTSEILGLAREVREISNGVADKIAGPVNCGEGKDANAPAPSGLLGEWTERLRKVREELLETRANINRIDC